MQEDEAYLTTSLLRSVVEEGTARRARSLGRPLAGKTGTTNKAKDAWFVGYSSELVAAVWVGYDDALPLGWGESGAVSALPAWIAFMKAAHEKRPSTEFSRPRGILEVKIDPATGLLARSDQSDAIGELFLEGTAPTEVADMVDAGADDGGATPEDPEAIAAAGDAQSPSGNGPENVQHAGASAMIPVGGEGGIVAEPPPF
jgi:penicillin-binding protein 1A